MKVLICYPPLSKNKGYPTLGQNRQFQYFKEPTFIYPVVPAQAATLLKEAGHKVLWVDCIAENIQLPDFMQILRSERPDLVAFETKTPVIKQHWAIINEIKKTFGAQESPKIALFGDHVTALPEESFNNSAVDFVLTGGDYDFLLKNLCQVLDKMNRSKTDLLEPGIYWKEGGEIKNSGTFKLDHDLNTIPFIDRDLTKWQLYSTKNGNYKRTPGTYIMSGRDCWWGKCTFCSWPTLYPTFRSRKPVLVLDEIEHLLTHYRIREIMDDSGSFPTGEWLAEFCKGMIARGIQKKVYLDCNMRFGALNQDEYRLMKKAGFRLLLFGLESANQKTLDRINKNLKTEDIIASCRECRKAGLFPHITIMFGYPWETYEDALNTLRLGKWLLAKGYAYTMQATVMIPYPGSPLFNECKKNGWLTTENWDDYDMKRPVMRTSISPDKILNLIQEMYKTSFQPEFVLRKIFSIRDLDDVKYYLRAGKKVAGHLFDFKKGKK